MIGNCGRVWGWNCVAKMQLHVTNLDLFLDVLKHGTFHTRMTSLKVRFSWALDTQPHFTGEKKKRLKLRFCLLFQHFDILLNPSNKNTCAGWVGEAWIEKLEVVHGTIKIFSHFVIACMAWRGFFRVYNVKHFRIFSLFYRRPFFPFSIIKSIHFSTHQELKQKHNTNFTLNNDEEGKKGNQKPLRPIEPPVLEFCVVSITEKSNFPFCQLYNGFWGRRR